MSMYRPDLEDLPLDVSPLGGLLLLVDIPAFLFSSAMASWSMRKLCTFSSLSISGATMLLLTDEGVPHIAELLEAGELRDIGRGVDPIPLRG